MYISKKTTTKKDIKYEQKEETFPYNNIRKIGRFLICYQHSSAIYLLSMKDKTQCTRLPLNALNDPKVNLTWSPVYF